MKSWLKYTLRNINADIRRAHKSLTIWFNGVIGSFVVALPEAQAAFPQLQEYLPTDAYRTMMGVLIAGNILLRFRTTKAVRDK